MSALQWCLPLVEGRGAGLGNELVPWARAYLMAEVLGARCLPPAFGLNARGYHRLFGTPRWDFAWHRVMRATLPCVHFGEAEFELHGGMDAATAFTRFADAQHLRQRRPLLVTTDGMWGGFQHVDKAREFVRGTLYRSRLAARNAAALSSRLDPAKLTVAMHVRLGDFEASTTDMTAYRGRFNCALPLSWFTNIGRQLQSAMGGRVQFQLFSDGSAEQLAPLRELLNPVSTACDGPAAASDLLALSQADLLVCSVSSYSVWAALLSSSPYLWFAPQMHRHTAGFGSVWGHEASQQRAGSPTLLALAAQAADPAANSPGRAFSIGLGAAVPDAVLDLLQRRMREKERSNDLVRCGVVPFESSMAGVP